MLLFQLYLYAHFYKNYYLIKKYNNNYNLFAIFSLYFLLIVLESGVLFFEVQNLF